MLKFLQAQPVPAVKLSTRAPKEVLEKARKELNVPEDYEIIHMIAIGNSGNPLELPEKIREMEKPNSRKPVKELVFEGSFK